MINNLGLYSVREAAELLGFTRSYAYYLIAVGKIKATRIGWQYVISQEEINRYKDSHNDKKSG